MAWVLVNSLGIGFRSSFYFFLYFAVSFTINFPQVYPHFKLFTATTHFLFHLRHAKIFISLTLHRLLPHKISRSILQLNFSIFPSLFLFHSYCYSPTRKSQYHSSLLFPLLSPQEITLSKIMFSLILDFTLRRHSLKSWTCFYLQHLHSQHPIPSKPHALHRSP